MVQLFPAQIETAGTIAPIWMKIDIHKPNVWESLSLKFHQNRTSRSGVIARQKTRFSRRSSVRTYVRSSAKGFAECLQKPVNQF